MNINGLNGNNNFIDATSAAKLSNDLFSALSKKTVDYKKQDLSKFTRATLGVDLYSTKTDINVQRQIAMTNAGMLDNKMNLNAVQALNSFAAQQLYSSSVSEKVGGKMTIDTANNEFEFVSKTEDVANLINVFETSKDKKDSNPFYFGEFTSNADKKEA